MARKGRSKPAEIARAVKGERIREAREAAGLSPLDVASSQRVWPGALSEIERNLRLDIEAATLKRICLAVNESADYVLGIVDIPKRERAKSLLADVAALYGVPLPTLLAWIEAQRAPPPKAPRRTRRAKGS